MEIIRLAQYLVSLNVLLQACSRVHDWQPPHHSFRGRHRPGVDVRRRLGRNCTSQANGRETAQRRCCFRRNLRGQKRIRTVPWIVDDLDGAVRSVALHVKGLDPDLKLPHLEILLGGDEVGVSVNVAPRLGVRDGLVPPVVSIVGLESHDVAELFTVEIPRLHGLRAGRRTDTCVAVKRPKTLGRVWSEASVLLTVHVMTISPLRPPNPATSVGDTTGAEKTKASLSLGLAQRCSHSNISTRPLRASHVLILRDGMLASPEPYSLVAMILN